MRLRLTLMYGALFLASGAALLTITYFLVKQDIGNSFVDTTKNGIASVIDHGPRRGGIAFGFASISSNNVVFSGRRATGNVSAKVSSGSALVLQVPVPGVAPGRAPSPKQTGEEVHLLFSEVQSEQAAELHQLLADSAIALVAMAVVSVLLGWLVAGRALRPLRVITSKAHDISSTNLHERIALRGPDDEMKRLGDTFDDLLARLETAFDAQRQFVANASHELRTPLARQRTLLEVAAADPDADVRSLRDASTQAIAAGEEQEKLIEALLTLASSERGLDQRSTFDLAELSRRVVASRRPEATLRGVDVDTSFHHAPTTGNERLVERLVTNLVENALRHNELRGNVTVGCAVEGDHAVFHVVNSGPEVPESELERLFEPFQRLANERVTGEGLGLGLSIVRSVASAHGATVTVRSRPAGGLDVRVAFPLDAVVAGDPPRHPVVPLDTAQASSSARARRQAKGPTRGHPGYR